MKQGHTLNRILMTFLFLAVVLYLSVSAWKSMNDPLTTTTSYAYTVTDRVEATGFLVREETVLTSTGGIPDVIPAEGEKVAKGTAVAYLYQDASALERKSQLRALLLERDQLHYAMRSAGDGSDSAMLSGQILDNITALRSNVAQRSLTDLQSDTMELKSLVYRRDYAFGEADLTTTQTALAAVNQQINALTTAAQYDTTAVRVNQSGVFSGMADGYESILTPAAIAAMSPSSLDALAQEEPVVPPNAVGKLITSSKWYFVAPISESDAARLTEGNRIAVWFSHDWSGEVSMKVERIGAPENGWVAVVLSSTRALSSTTLLRRQTVDIVFQSYTGVRVPKEAVRVAAQDVTDPSTGVVSGTENITGVYVLVGAQAEFKPITILAEEESYFVVDHAPFRNDQNQSETKKALRAGDEIIVKAERLYDGKVVRTG